MRYAEWDNDPFLAPAFRKVVAHILAPWTAGEQDISEVSVTDALEALEVDVTVMTSVALKDAFLAAARVRSKARDGSFAEEWDKVLLSRPGSLRVRVAPRLSPLVLV